MSWAQFILIIGVVTLCYYLLVGGYILLKNGKLFGMPKGKPKEIVPQIIPVNNGTISTKKTINQNDFILTDNSFNEQNKFDFDAASLNYQNGIIDLSGENAFNNDYEAELPSLEDTFNENEKITDNSNEIFNGTSLETKENYLDNDNLNQFESDTKISQQLFNLDNDDIKNEKLSQNDDLIIENDIPATNVTINTEAINEINKEPTEKINETKEPIIEKPLKMDSLLHLINNNLNSNGNNS